MRRPVLIAAFAAVLLGSLCELLTHQEATAVTREPVAATALSEVEPPEEEAIKTKFFFPQKPEDAVDQRK